MTEVEVFSGGENVALQGTATQSSTLDGAVAGRAIDGKTDKGSHAYSRTNLEPSPWWELKLMEAVPVDQLRVHKLSEWDPNVAWTLTMQLLDSNRKVLWQDTLDETVRPGRHMELDRRPRESGSDSAEAPKPIVAQFFRLELRTTDTSSHDGPAAIENHPPPDNPPITSPEPTSPPDGP